MSLWDFTDPELVMADALAKAGTAEGFGDVRLEASEVVACLKDLGWEVRRANSEPLPSVAPSRGPKTSDEAAASIDNMSARHRAVLDVARGFARPFTYDDLISRYTSREESGTRDLPRQLPSSIRSRCKELREAGWITKTGGNGRSDAGRPCSLWQVIR